MTMSCHVTCETMTEMRLITFHIEPEMHEALKKLAEASGLTVSEIIRCALLVKLLEEGRIKVDVQCSEEPKSKEELAKWLKLRDLVRETAEVLYEAVSRVSATTIRSAECDTCKVVRFAKSSFYPTCLLCGKRMRPRQVYVTTWKIFDMASRLKDVVLSHVDEMLDVVYEMMQRNRDRPEVYDTLRELYDRMVKMRDNLKKVLECGYGYFE